MYSCEEVEDMLIKSVTSENRGPKRETSCKQLLNDTY